MKLTDEVKKLFNFDIGDTVYIKQDVVNDRSRMNVNGRQVDEILLQHASILMGMELEVFDECSYAVTYFLRAGGMRLMGARDSSNVNLLLRARGHELCNEREAIVILNLKKSA